MSSLRFIRHNYYVLLQELYLKQLLEYHNEDMTLEHQKGMSLLVMDVDYAEPLMIGHILEW